MNLSGGAPLELAAVATGSCPYSTTPLVARPRVRPCARRAGAPFARNHAHNSHDRGGGEGEHDDEPVAAHELLAAAPRSAASFSRARASARASSSCFCLTSWEAT